jgi:hypothetical protein
MAIQKIYVEIKKRRQSLIKRIQAKALESGRVPKLSDFSSSQRFCFFEEFGRWNDALFAAGIHQLARRLRPRLVSRLLQGQSCVIIDDECLDALNRLSAVLGGYRPTIKDIASTAGIETGCPSASTINNSFGSIGNALRAAGLDQLQTKYRSIHNENREKEESDVSELINGKTFAMLSDSPGHQKMMHEIADKMGIPFVSSPSHKELRIVLNWMRGQAYEGVLLSHEEIEIGMGEKAYAMLVQYCQGMSMAEVGRSLNLSRERVRQVITKKTQGLVRTVLREGGRK